MCYFGGLGDVKNLFADLSCACVVPSGYWIQYTYALHSPKGKGRKETMAKIIHVAQSSVMVSVVLVAKAARDRAEGEKYTCSGVHIHPFGFASNAKASASATPKASSPRGVLCSNAQSDG